MQKKYRKICVYQKKAVPLHPLSDKHGLGSSSYLVSLERFTTRSAEPSG